MISDAFVYANCDHPGCNSSEEVACTALAGGGYDCRNVPDKLKEMGWSCPDGVNGNVYCPEHARQGSCESAPVAE